MTAMKTAATFAATLSVLGDRGEGDEIFSENVLCTIVDDDEQEIEVAFSDEKNRIYVRFRMGDLRRAVKEFPTTD